MGNAVFFQFAVERGTAYAQTFRAGTHIAPVFLQAFGNDVFFHFIKSQVSYCCAVRIVFFYSEMFRFYGFAVRQMYSPFNGAFQLSDVSGPRIIDNKIINVGSEAFAGVKVAEAFKKIIDKKGNVISAFPKRGNEN